MQTFITETRRIGVHGVCARTAATLDNARLGKQRVEAKQIYEALFTGKGWVHHPATKMWNGYEQALAVYGWYMCLEWIERGFEDTLQEYFAERIVAIASEVKWPWWFGHPEMVASHRSKLFHKSPTMYSQFEPEGKVHLPYLWPNTMRLYISGAEFKRLDWTVPQHWHVNTHTREVTFDHE